VGETAVTLVVAEMPDEDRSCPLPSDDYPRVVMAHGGGGRLSAELVQLSGEQLPRIC
jgi:hypothetical protein